MANSDSTVEFDTSLFLQFLFSVIFLFVCCFTLMLYVDKALAFATVVLLRFLVLPRNIRIGLSGLHIAPLQGRVLFRDFTFQTENLSLHIVDGYVTLAFWGFWFKRSRWSRVHEYMVCDTLVGTRCRVRRNLAYVKGTVVHVDVEKRKVSVQFDEQGTNSSGDDIDVDDAGTGTEPHPDPLPRLSGDLNHSVLRETNSTHNSNYSSAGESPNVKEATPAPLPPQSQCRSTLKEFTTPVSVPDAEALKRGSNPPARSEGLGDEVVKVVDANDVFVRSRAGLLQIHLNGVRLCIYNATGKYLDLAKAAATQAANSASATAAGSVREGRGNNNNGSNTAAAAAAAAAAARRDKRGPTADEKKTRKAEEALRRHGKVATAKEGVKRAVIQWVRKAADNSQGWEQNDLDAQGMTEPPVSAEVRAARKLQEHNILNTSFAQKFFNFIGCVELEICSAHVDLGAVAGTHPYFLHLTFHQGEGRVFLTKDSCPALDLYRFVTELTLREVDVRMAQLDSKLSKTQVMRNATLYECARLLFSGVAESYEHLPFETPSSSELISQYGVLMDGKDKGTVHLVCYKDAANVYAGEPVRRGALPTTGVEVLIDTPVIRYGPWLEYCRMQLWQYFLPPNYLPLQELQFVVGLPRPNAGFELLVLFLRDTTCEIPFKRRSIVPSPPFGIKDSRRKAKMVATIGAGAQYIQPAFFLLPKEEKQVFQGLFIAKDVTVWANCVLDRETILCHADSVQFFVDRQDDRLWNGRKLFNILTKLSGVEMYWYMVYVDYFLDLLNDWQFAASMYHDAPLSTELFNTLNRSVRDFIPNVKRFEVFVESTASIHLNVNTHNVVYAEDPNDLAHNIMATVKLQSGSFSVVLPSDQYQLSYENEVTRPLEASAREIKAYLSLPPSHPLHDQASATIPWAYSETFKMNGLFVMQVPNQSIPISRDNMDPTTGRTKLHNYFTLDLEFTNLRGTLMGTHIKALIQSFQNIFLDNTFTIAPDELFWLLAKLQSHATTGKNKRKEFKQFLEQSQPAGNDMEICVSVRLVDVSATATTGQVNGSPQVNLSTGLVTFTYVKQFAVTDTGVTLSPITVRFPDRRGNFSRNAESNMVVGAIAVALTKHFGQMPLKPKVHESMEVIVDGVSLEATAEQLMLLVDVAQTIGRHLLAEDMMMEAEVADALSAAELLAEKVVRAGPLRNTTDAPRSGGMRRRRAGRGGTALFGSGAAVPAGPVALNASFEPSPDDPEGTSRVDDDDDAAGDAVEMQEWRSARRAAALPQGFQIPGEMEGEEEEVQVSVQPSFITSTPTTTAVPFSQTASAVSPQEPLEPFNTGGGGVPILHSYENDAARPSTVGKHGHSRKRRRLFFADSPTSSAHTSDTEHDVAHQHPFASTVPYDVALGFANFMDECNKASDDSKDYGLFFLMVNIGSVRGVVRIGEDGYAALELPAGVTMAQSTVNDGNSNKRLSAAAKDLGVQLMLHRTSEMALFYLPSLKDESAGGNYLEVMALHTSLCVRQYVAYPFDKSLENHRSKQMQFVEENDYEQLIGFPFQNAATHCPPTVPSKTPAAAAANAETAGQGVSSSTRRTPSTAVAMPEPATMPRPTPLNKTKAADLAAAAATMSLVTEAPDAATRGYSPVANQASGSVPPMPPTTRSWIPAELLLHPPGSSAEGDNSAASPLQPRPFPHDSRGSDVSSDSLDTMAHNNNAKGNDNDASGGKWSGCASLSDTMFPTDKEKPEDSNRFETCVSLSADSSASCTGSTDDFFNDSSSEDSSRRMVDNRAFAADRCVGHSGNDGPVPARAGRSPQAPQGPQSTKPSTAPSKGFPAGGAPGARGSSAASVHVPPHLFYRTFDKAESDDNGVCATDYWPPQRPSGPQKVRDRTGFHAQLPIVGFYPNLDLPTRAPVFFSSMKRDMLQAEADLFAWARCVVDNRERSKHNSTSRHLHVALLDPMTVLVTPEAAVLAGAAVRLFLQMHASLGGPKNTDLQRAASPLVNAANSTSPAAAPPRLLRSHAKKSKTRTQQKRWLWEDNIMSVSVPAIEVKLLTRLPVPAENLPDPSCAVDGVYSSTILVRNLRGIIAQNRPPSGEEVGDASQKVSASLKLDTFAVVTQIEWEPLQREGNLLAKVPLVWYDSAKPSLAVVFLTQVAGKGKRDLWRGTDGGACNITTAQIACHVTRDFADYVDQLRHLIKEVIEDVRGRLRAAGKERLSGSWIAYNESSSVTPGNTDASPLSPEWNAFVSRAGEGARTHKSSTIQGKGFLGSVTIRLIDTARVRQRIVVNEHEVSHVELRKPFCNFVAVMPRLLRDRQVHIQGVGEIDLVRAHVLPSALHVLRPRAAQRNRSIAAKLPSGSPHNGCGVGGKSPAVSVPTFLGSPQTATMMEGRSAFSISSPQESSAAAAAAARQGPEKGKPLLMIYDGTFTVHQLDLSAKHSDSNYVRLLGKELTGCAESRMESVASRECVQTEALTETISDVLKARLRSKANRARERAKRSRYPAPPESTEQLHLHSTASFFAHQLQLHYVAECAMEPISHESGPRCETTASAPHIMQRNKIFTADIASVVLVAQFASQFNVRGDQTNLHMIVRHVVFDSPYCLQAAEMLHPQVNALVSSWRNAVSEITNSMRRERGDGSKSSVAAATRRGVSFSDKEVSRVRRSSAITLQMQATSITGYAGLPQGIVQKFLLPQISCFTKSSSNGRVDVKLHLHPFTITAHNAPQENYRVVLPHVYLLYSHDTIKMLCSVTMGTIAITITPLFINHTLLTYEKLINDVLVVLSSPAASDETVGSPTSLSPGANDDDGAMRRDSSSWPSGGSGGAGNDDVGQDTHTRGKPKGGRERDAADNRGGGSVRSGGGNPLSSDRKVTSVFADEQQQQQPSVAEPDNSRSSADGPRRRRRSFLFLLQGVRLSYLTSMTTLRFTIRNLNATADTTEGHSRQTLRWVVHVTDAQAALVDRDDHDQMMATYNNLTGASNGASPTVRDMAQVAATAFGNGRGIETANKMKAAHPLGGFLWGSVGLSLTLSSGKVDENRLKKTLQESASFSSYSEELRNALMESFTNSTSKWELAVYEPLVILRIGLDALIKQCLQETEDDVREMKRVTHEESLTAILHLHRLKRFQRLQAKKRRLDRLLRRAQKEQQRKLRTMTEQVAHDMAYRRGGAHPEGSENSGGDMLDHFSTVKSHKVVATVTGFLVVVPFGDAPFRRILEKLPDTFACGKTDRHIHTASCLNRRELIPSYALKIKVSDLSFICNVEVVKRLVPVLVADPSGHPGLPDSIYATGGSVSQGCNTTMLFSGRVLAQDSHVFFTGGSPLRGEVTLSDILRTTSVLGGKGLLTSYAADEHEHSLNNFAVDSIEVPLRVERQSNTMTVGVVVDVSEPKGCISSLLLSLLQQLSLEQPTSKLEAHLLPRRRRGRTSTQAERARASSGGDNQRVLYSEEVQAPTEEPMCLHLDITGRIEASELAVYCFSDPERFSTANTAQNAGAAMGGGSGGSYPDSHTLRATKLSSTERRVGFDMGLTIPGNSRWRTPKNTPADAPGQAGIADNTHNRYLIMSLPLPGVVVRTVARRGRGEGVDDIAMVRAELRVGTMELSPYITALAQEVEMCTTSYVKQRVERNKGIFSFVQQMEEEVPLLGVPLHCALIEVLLPMPRAYAAALGREEMHTAVRLRRSQAQGGGGYAADDGADNDDDDGVRSVSPPPQRRARGLTAVHLTISDFCLVFTTEPAASTSFTLYLDNGGTIDVIFKHFLRNDVKERFLRKFPDVSVAVTLRRLRAECQTKLEVKSLELFLPEAELSISRRSGLIGVVDNIAAYFPCNAEGTEPNLTVRLQHVSQLFLVLDMWSFTTSETLRSIRHLFARGAAGDDIAKRMARTQLGQQVVKGNHALHEVRAKVVDRRRIVFVGLSHALCLCDIGAGSAHHFTIGEAHMVAEAAVRATGCSVNLLIGRATNTSIRSEGVLSGGMIMDNVFAKAFVIQNAEDAEVFVRSPEQRTFREALLVQQVHVNFKERQLKDVFDCKVGDFRGNSMDGIGEEDFTTTDLDASLHHGSLGVTPSTVPALLNFVRNISTIIAEQRRVSAAKLKEKTLHLRHAESATKRPRSVPKAGGANGFDHLPAAGPEHGSDSENSHSSTSTQPARGCIPHFGNRLLRVPCGQFRIGLDDTTVLLGAISSSEATSGCVVVSFSKGRLSFAECPCDDYRAAKKVLVIETHNVELFRPGAPRVVVMGFHGVNHFEFYTRQVLGSAEVGFTLTLRQTNPWTGNPRFRDFEEMIHLIKSFTDKKNADVIKKFGRVDTTTFPADGAGSPLPRERGVTGLAAGMVDLDSQTSPTESIRASPTVENVAAVVKMDERTLKALRSSKFSPQLRFGGDVSVNTEVILNWLGVTEKMLPHVVHMALCDKLEKLLNSLASFASERVHRRKRADTEESAKPPLSRPEEARKLEYH
ncbi:hypothetical protein ABB37_06612 [Leptomonas pyrrhocoris]|uniref:Fragile site-associated protein C-terminal domain-containing protein n=1 Tax=Leptomonas pyrrhocoris TaxID=157538 RepID=A0A0N0DTY7_LEPPY|nr:hypothetical protein ABB37_06612 [Leptomonas pyrrhocoris]KPA77781.1 hypothetical protein ABB37_06612 [Leptomonas pyrrhocoris]|eukprot:XP_015656220.1 hypothetical protein ABB37_06612 [Leptomonas pyrrhocoris]